MGAGLAPLLFLGMSHHSRMKSLRSNVRKNATSSLLVVALFLAPPLIAQKASVALPREGTTNHLQVGMRLARAQKWAEAEREFRIAHQNDPNSNDAELGHAEALVKVGQPFDAALELQSFLRDHPNAAKVHQFYAVVTLSISDDFLLAQSEMEKCVKLLPNDGMAWKSLGDISLDHTTPKDAIEAYKKATHLLPDNPLILASLADAYSQSGDNNKAEEAFGKAIKMTAVGRSSEQAARDRAGVQYLYGRYLLAQGHPKESIAATTRALSYNSHSSVALYNRARAYLAIGDYKSAEADALRAFGLTPHDKQGPLLLIDIYRKQQDSEKAQKYAESAQKLVDEEQQRSAFGRDVRRLLGVAEGALQKGQFSEAIPPYEELIAKVPTFYEAYFGVGMSYSQTGRFSDAETALRKYLAFQPVSGDGHAALGVLLLQMNRGPEAVTELKQALQIDPTLDEARKALASEYLNESKPEESLRILRAAQNTKDPQLIVMLASVLMRQGDTVNAKREVGRALTLQPDDPDALRLKQEILSKILTRK
jgi:tetratricopeptide (TPR) repeat protein